MKSCARADKKEKRKKETQGCWDVIYFPTGSSVMLMSWGGAGRISRDPPFIQHMVYAAFPSRHFLSFTTTHKLLWVNISGAVRLGSACCSLQAAACKSLRCSLAHFGALNGGKCVCL